MDIEATLLDNIKKFESIKTQIGDISTKIGGLTEQQRALYNQGLELKGRIDMLVELKAKEAEALAGSQTAKLTLPVGVKPVAAEAPAPVVNGSVVEAAPEEAKKQPTVLEVK